MAFDYVGYLRGIWGGDKGQPLPFSTKTGELVFVSEIRTLLNGGMILFGWARNGSFLTWATDGTDECAVLYQVPGYHLRNPRQP